MIARLLADIGEFGLIERQSGRLGQQLPAGWIGIGDDAAVIPLSALGGSGSTSLVVTTDILVENRHFRRDYSSFTDIGWKTLAVSLSDVAAMAGRPLAAVLTLQIPADVSVRELDEFYDGLGELATAYQVAVLGGDTVQANELVFGATVLGICDRGVVLRGGARAGDDIWVTGSIGAAGTALQIKQGKLKLADTAEAFRRYQRPEPRIELAQRLAEKKVFHSMIDISDGLLQDAQHIAQMSQAILVIEANKIPLHRDVAKLNVDVLQAASFGDDYELLFTAPVEHREAIKEIGAEAVTLIGTVRSPAPNEMADVCVQLTDGSSAMLEQLIASGRTVGGYRHFGGK